MPRLKRIEPLPPDIGLCCAFNHNSLKTMLSGKKFANMVKDIEEKYNEMDQPENLPGPML
jgi:hypothetical protein